MSTLSAVIITKNEEKRIEKCLNSIKDWVDEIVIIDDLSTDNTVEICKKFTDKVFINDSGGWLDYVNRNLGIEKASGKWILSLDADEIIPPSTKEKIFEIIRSDAPYVAYKFLRKNFFLGKWLKHGGLYHYHFYLFKKGYAYYKKQKIHSPLLVKGEVKCIDVEVEHYPFSSIRDFLIREAQYIYGEAEDILREKGIFDVRKIKRKALKDMWKTFKKYFLKRKGYKDGAEGIIYGILSTYYHFLKWSVYWEITNKKDKK